MGKAGMGRDTHHGHQAPVQAENELDEHDLADERQGYNKLQGNDQAQVRAQRHSIPKVGGATGGGDKPTGNKPMERGRK